MLDARPEGVYCRWETYPPAVEPVGDEVIHVPVVPGGHMKEFTDNILHIEKVWGDCSVTSFECASSEAETIFNFLRSSKIHGNS